MNLKEPVNDNLLSSGGIDSEEGDKIIENVIGKLSLPLGIVPMILINNKKYSVPMCTEEPSVVAATSSIGKFFAPHSFIATSSPSMMIGQVHLIHVEASELNQILLRKESIILELNKCCRSMEKRGGGVKDIRVREISQSGSMDFKDYSMDIIINVCDAMGANITNTIAEKAKEIVSFMGIKTGISILSNYCIERKSVSKFMIPVEKLTWKGHKGSEVAERLLEAYRFAKTDVYRAVTHNKGIMNGVDAVCLATGQDWRAIESAAHAYAARNGTYEPLTHYEIIETNGKKFFMGMLELPVAVGTIGGTITKNGLYKEVLRIMGNPTTQELAEIIVTVGLAQNFAALRAMAVEGIQKGHMKLHMRSVMNSMNVPENMEEECFNYVSRNRKFNEEGIKEFMETQATRPRL
jgi:degradative hydroxymethylglutaryl-CoA reductase